MKIKLHSLLIGLFIFSSFLKAQSTMLLTIKQDFLNSLRVGAGLSKELITPSLIKMELGLGIVLLSSIDEPTSKTFKNNQNHTNDFLFHIDRFYGEKNVLLPASFLLYTVGLISHKPSVRILGLKSGQALVYSGLITIFIKELLGRARPNQHLGAYTFKPFSFKEEWRSFPSGHTSLSFAFSTIMAQTFSNKWWKVFWYGSASLVACARIYHQQHWLSDVVAGGLLGWAVAHFVLKNEKDPSTTAHWHFEPFLRTNNGTQAGMRIKYQF